MSKVKESALDSENSDSLNSVPAVESGQLESGLEKSSSTQPSEWNLNASCSVLGAFLALFCTFGQLNTFGTYQTWYQGHQLANLSPSTISWIGSVQVSIFFLVGGPIGRLFDRFGPKWLMTTGTVLCVISIMVTSVSEKFYHFFLAQGILFGLGVGLMFYPALSSVSTHFKRHRATAIGIAGAGSGLGGAVYPIMMERLLTQLNFPRATRISGFLSAACCIVSVFTVTRNIPPNVRQSRPSINFRNFTDTPYVLLCSGSMFVSLGLYIPYFYIVSYAHDRFPSDFTTLTGFYVLAILNVGSIVGRVLPAFLSDLLGRFNILFPSAFFSGASSLVIWMCIETTGTSSLASLIVFALVYGFFSGAFISIITPCISQISDVNKVGSRIGVLYSLVAIPCLVGGPIAGALISHSHGSFTSAIAFSGSSVIVGSSFILFSKLSINGALLSRV